MSLIIPATGRQSSPANTFNDTRVSVPPYSRYGSADNR